MFQHFDYNRKQVFPNIIFNFADLIGFPEGVSDAEKEEIQRKLTLLAASFEYVTMGHFLHDQIEGK